MNYESASEILIDLQDCIASPMNGMSVHSCHGDQSTLRPTMNYVALLRACQ